MVRSMVGRRRARVQVWWVLKTAPKRKPELATEVDAAAGSYSKNPALPLNLSPEAQAAGWTGLVSVRQLVSADVAEKLLREGFFEDESIGRLVLNPLLFGVALFLVLLLIRERFQSQSSHEERHGRRTKGPELISAWKAKREQKDGGIKLQLKRKFGLLPSSFQIPRRLESSHILLMGDTGSGKTTTLAVIREGVEASGYRSEGFAPTSGAAARLAEAGIETSTLQMHLAKGQRTDTDEKTLYVVDESSLASSKQMHDFVARLHPNDRVLLVGDTRQHEAVEAGRPFAQLQEAGMVTVKLNEIVRQKDPELKHVVEQLARGEVREAVEGLGRQGRVHEVKDPAQRIEAIAKEYARSPDNTLVVSPDNRSRSEINAKIHSELQARGIVGKEEYKVGTLVTRQDLTGADRTWAARYEPDNVLLYSRSSKDTGIKKGEYARVKHVDAPKNLLTVVRFDGSERTYDPRRQQGVSVYRDREKAFSAGDRLQFTAPSKSADLKVANRDLATIESITDDGRMQLKMDRSGRRVSFDPREHPHIDHGHAVTSHSSQGQTADRVLIHVDPELGAKNLLNNRMAYVAVSHGGLRRAPSRPINTFRRIGCCTSMGQMASSTGRMGTPSLPSRL